ncbi:rhodanese-like domain-containing protein [Hazenella coriacea]|uniref:Rhodanese-related sulfurtransferase n=1 Tax=Hazenella coriacea TaxID=1179467 RepID=A0A4R3LA56_9BACL|nr:rhodanese-like domain-containing protein [Hazenella coriacea]TCS96572.1 rhodanese-related sulfurtransferase [Hazenella coriacea]
MHWLQWMILGLILFLLIKPFLPNRWLTNLTPTQVKDLLKKPQEFQFIDVREPFEYKNGHIKGIKNIPMSQLSQRQQEISHDRAIVITCQSGFRSKRAAKILKRSKFKNLSHLERGVNSWEGKLSK